VEERRRLPSLFSFLNGQLLAVKMNVWEMKTIFWMDYPTKRLYEVPLKTMKQENGETIHSRDPCPNLSGGPEKISR